MKTYKVTSTEGKILAIIESNEGPLSVAEDYGAKIYGQHGPYIERITGETDGPGYFWACFPKVFQYVGQPFKVQEVEGDE